MILTFYGFLLYNSTVKTQTERVQVKYEKLLAMVRSPDSNSDFKESRKVLVKELRAVDKDIKELRKAVDMVPIDFEYILLPVNISRHNR